MKAYSELTLQERRDELARLQKYIRTFTAAV